jgi:hypothetical protein
VYPDHWSIDAMTRRRNVIAVSVLDVAAVAAALFIGLQSHSNPVTHHVAVAQAAPPSSAVNRLLEEEARARGALRAATTASEAQKAQERRAREAARAAAELSRAQRLRERLARRSGTHSRAAEGQAAAERAPRTAGSQRQPKSKQPKHTDTAKPHHDTSAHEEAQAKREQKREQSREEHERQRASRESAREKRREERRAPAGKHPAVP